MVLLLVALLLPSLSELKLCPRALSLAALAHDSSLLWVIQQLAGLIPDMVREKNSSGFKSSSSESWLEGTVPGHAYFGVTVTAVAFWHVLAFRRVLVYWRGSLRLDPDSTGWALWGEATPPSAPTDDKDDFLATRCTFALVQARSVPKICLISRQNELVITHCKKIMHILRQKNILY